MSQAVLDRAPLAPADVLTGEEPGQAIEGGSARHRWRTWLWVLLAPLGVVALIAAIVVPQLGGSGLRPGEAELDANGGRASVQHGQDGSVEQITGSTRVRTGDIVTAELGEPSLRLPGGGELALRSVDGAATSVKVAASPELRTGELLATSKTRPYDLVADGTAITVAAGDDGSAVRLARTNSTVDVGVYQGRASIDSAGIRDTVPALRQVAVTGLRNVDQAYAMPIDTADPWDRRYLAPAIDAQHLVDPLRTSFDGLVDNVQLTASQLDRAVPGLLGEDALTSRLAALPQGLDPGSVLVGATIASLSTRGAAGSRWDGVFSFHDEGGATWGLVAMDQGVTPAALNQALQDAVQRLLIDSGSSPTLANAPGPPGTVPIPAVTTPQAPVVDGGTGGASTPGVGTSPSATTTPQSNATPEPSPPTTPKQVVPLPTVPAPVRVIPGGGGAGGGQQGSILEPLLNTVGGLLNGLLR